MAIEIQFRRGTTAQNNAFTGAEGELTYDTQAKKIRIHDGATAGGKTMAAEEDVAGIVDDAVNYAVPGAVSSAIAALGAGGLPFDPGTVFSSDNVQAVIEEVAADSSAADAALDGRTTLLEGGVFGLIKPTSWSANQDNYAPSGYANTPVFMLTTDTTTRYLHGIAGGVDGRLIVVFNDNASTDIIISDEEATSTAANRIDLRRDIRVQPKTGVLLVYDGATSRWKLATPDATKFAGEFYAYKSSIIPFTTTWSTLGWTESSDAENLFASNAYTPPKGERFRIHCTVLALCTGGFGLFPVSAAIAKAGTKIMGVTQGIYYPGSGFGVATLVLDYHGVGDGSAYSIQTAADSTTPYIGTTDPVAGGFYTTQYRGHLY